MYVPVQNFLWFQVLLCSSILKCQKEMKKIKPDHIPCKLVQQCFVCLFVCLFVYLLILFNLTESKLQKVANRHSPNARESKTVLDTGFYAVNLELQLLDSRLIFCSWNPEFRKFLLVKSRILGFGIRNTAQGIQNPI